jgi:hypothetical protein
MLEVMLGITISNVSSRYTNQLNLRSKVNCVRLWTEYLAQSCLTLAMYVKLSLCTSIRCLYVARKGDCVPLPPPMDLGDDFPYDLFTNLANLSLYTLQP